MDEEEEGMICEFCGRELGTKMIPGLRREVPMPCDCIGAVRHREEEDRRERERNWRETFDRAIANADIPSAMTLYPTWGDSTPCYLFGEQGRGKSEMACGAIRKFVADGIVEIDRNRFFSTRSAKFVTGPDMMMRLRRTYDQRGESESDLMWSYAGVGMLCIDDLGKGKLTDWTLERIYLILDMRSREGRPTFVTTQYDIDSLTELFARASDVETAKAIRSRIEGGCRILNVGGPDWRVRQEAFQNSQPPA